jgi:hypothetical protein
VNPQAAPSAAAREPALNLSRATVGTLRLGGQGADGLDADGGFRRRRGPFSPARRLAQYLSRRLIGYGYHCWYALGWLLACWPPSSCSSSTASA